VRSLDEHGQVPATKLMPALNNRIMNASFIELVFAFPLQAIALRVLPSFWNRVREFKNRRRRYIVCFA
jgi:hypothetical protein